MAAARDKTLPPISVKSGRPAEGYAPVTVANRRIFLPLTQAEFERVTDLQHRQKWSLGGGVGCLAFGVAMARFPVMLPLAVVIALLSAALWGLIWFALRTYLPSMDVEGSRIRMGRVHEGFAAAVAAES